MNGAYNALKVLRTVKIKVPSNLQSLDKVLTEFNQIYQDFIALRDWLQCRLALAEGFTNAVRHAHKNLPPDVPIKIEVFLSQTNIKIKIWDYGSAFDLHNFIAENAQKNNDWLGSGRGISIMNKICDRLDYYRTEKENCLLIVKLFDNHQPDNNFNSPDTN